MARGTRKSDNTRMTTDQGQARRYGVGYALGAFVLIRAVVMIAAHTAPQTAGRPEAAADWWKVPTLRWDGGHYRTILETGYPRRDGQLPPAPESDTVAFFPLYPLMARPLAAWMSPSLALVVLTHFASAVAMVFLYLWARRRYNPRTAFWCVLVLSAYPPAMFFSAAYADGLLVLWVALTLWLLEHRRVWSAGLICGLATATRPTGLVLAAVLMLWAIQHRPKCPWPRQLARLGALGMLSISGLLAYQLYLWHYYQRPDAFVAVQSNWEKTDPQDNPVLWIVTLKPVLQPALGPLKYALRGDIERLLTPVRWNALWNVILVTIGIIGLARPGPVPRVFFLLPILVFLEAWLPDPCRGHRLLGIARYQLMALPSFLLLAAWMTTRWPALLRAGLIVVWLMMQCMYVRAFANAEMVG